MLFAAILFLGILSMWIPARWALSIFQVAVFALAAARIVQRKNVAIHPTAVLLGAAVVWGFLQAFGLMPLIEVYWIPFVWVMIQGFNAGIAVLSNRRSAA